MRILYSHYLTTDDHPAVRMVHAIAAELRELGHEVCVHRTEPVKTSHAQKTTAARGAGSGSLRSVRRRLWFARAVAENVGGYRRDAAALQSFKPDVVLARQDAYRYSMPLACMRAGVPLVTFADAPVAYETRHVNSSSRWHPPRLVESIEKWGLRRSRAVITVSHPAARLLDRYGLNVPIHIAPNGVDTARFKPPTESERAETRQRLGVTTPRVAGFVGTFQPFHGLALLGDLIRLTADRTDLTWLLVGDGVGRSDLETMVKGHPRVVFAGRQSPDKVAELLGAMDVLVAPRQQAVPVFYFCPLKVLEAMAAGVACLAGDQGDIPLLLDGGRAGFLVPTDRPADWARCLTSLLDNTDVRTLLGATARRRAEAEYTWRRTAETVASVLEDAIARPSVGSQDIASPIVIEEGGARPSFSLSKSP